MPVKINMGAITPSLFESEMFGHERGAYTAQTDEVEADVSGSPEVLLNGRTDEVERQHVLVVLDVF